MAAALRHLGLEHVAGTDEGDLDVGRISGNSFEIEWPPDTIVALEPIGTVFIRLIMMIVVPLVVASVIRAIAAGEGSEELGRMGVLAVVFFLSTTPLYLTIVLPTAALIQPGHVYRLQQGGRSLSPSGRSSSSYATCTRYLEVSNTRSGCRLVAPARYA